MATHSSILAWEIPWTEEPDGLQSMRLQRVGHDWATSLHFTSLVAQSVKNLPVVKETWVWSLGWEDSLEKGRTIYSSILAWGIPWTEGLGGLPSMRLQRVGHDWANNTFTFILGWVIWWEQWAVGICQQFHIVKCHPGKNIYFDVKGAHLQISPLTMTLGQLLDSSELNSSPGKWIY